jgi:hypothetical protein
MSPTGYSSVARDWSVIVSGQKLSSSLQCRLRLTRRPPPGSPYLDPALPKQQALRPLDQTQVSMESSIPVREAAIALSLSEAFVYVLVFLVHDAHSYVSSIYPGESTAPDHLKKPHGLVFLYTLPKKPCDSSSNVIWCTMFLTVIFSQSTVKSASVGFSYGSLTPVKFLIEFLLARA